MDITLLVPSIARHRVLGLALLSGWLLLSGVIDLALGVMIWRGLPMSRLTVVGLLVGISILFRGVWWLMLGFSLRRIPRPAA